MDLRTLNDGSITRKYQRRLAVGIPLLVLLAFPAVIYSYRAITQLFNLPSAWIPADLPVRIDFDDFSRRFSVTDIVLAAWDGAELGSEQLDEVTRLLQPLAKDPTPAANVAVDAAPNPGQQLRGRAVEIVANVAKKLDQPPLLWARSGTELLAAMTSAPANLSRASAIKRLSGSIVGPDEKQTALVLSLSADGNKNRRYVMKQIRLAIAAQLDVLPDAIAFVGGPYDGTVIDEASIRSVELYSPPSAILAALLCYFCLRSFVLTAAVTLIAVVGEGLVLAAVYFTGSPMNAVLIVLPPLVFVLTVSSGIHLSNYYLDALHEFPLATRAQAAAIAMRAGTLPCLLAASTTVIGLGSLVLVRLEPIRIFGMVAVMGLLITLALLLLILPGAMLFYGGPRTVSDHELLHGPITESLAKRRRRQFTILFRRVLRHPIAVIATFIVSMMVMGIGLFRLDTSVNVPRMFDEEHSLRRQYDWFEKHVGPTINGEILIRFPADQLDGDPIDRLDLIRDAHIATARAQDVGGVLSAISFLPSVPKGRGLSATANRSVIRAQLIDPQSSIRKLDHISRDEIAEVWRISFRLPTTTKSDHGPEVEAIVQTVRDAIVRPGDAGGVTLNPEVVITGSVEVGQVAGKILLRDLFTSFLSAFAVVAVVMMILLRSVLGGLLAMLPNLFPTITLFGYMGLTGLPLDIGSVMTASVALGIAVDDTIHLLSRFGSRTARGIPRRKAAWGSLQQCGMAMFQTTLVCGLSLLVYSLSDFVPTRRFAFLMFGLLTMALIGDLLFLPAILASRFGVWMSRPVMADAGAELRKSRSSANPPVDVRRVPAANQGKITPRM